MAAVDQASALFSYLTIDIVGSAPASPPAGYMRIYSLASSVWALDEYGNAIQLAGGGGGGLTPTLTSLTVNNQSVFNESGGNYDTRIEGDTDQNLVFVDASADFVGIGTATPGYKLDVNGTLHSAGTATLNALAITTTGGAGHFLRQTSAGGVVTSGALAAADLPNTAVTPGSYTSADITVDAQGRITAAANGVGGGAPATASFITVNAEAGLSNETTWATMIASPGNIGATTAAAGNFTVARIKGAAATDRSYVFCTVNTTRWDIAANATAEGGANAGSDLVIRAYNDAGTLLSSPITITRSNAQVALSATGGAGHFLKQTSAGGVLSSGLIAASDLPNTAVTPGSYTYAGITVDAQGRITSASNGTAPAPANATYIVDSADGTLSAEVLWSTKIASPGALGGTTPAAGTFTTLSVTTSSTHEGSAVFNEAGAAVNFRVESDTNINMLFVDGTNNRVGVGLNNPSSTLHVNGTFEVNGSSLFSGDIDASSVLMDVSDLTVASTFTLNAVGGAGHFLKQTSLGGVVTSGTIAAADLPNTAVTPGSYTSADITVDAQGRITAAANGVGGGGAPATASFVTVNAEAGLSNETTWATMIASPGALGGTTPAAGTFTGLTVNTTAPNLVITGTAANTRSLKLQTAGVDRWIMRANATAEGGANAGSNLELEAYTDAGASVGVAISIQRSNRVVTISNGLIITASGLTIQGGGIGITGGATVTTGNLTVTNGTIAVAQAVATTNTVTNVGAIQVNSTGTPAAGFGLGLNFQAETTTTANVNLGRIRWEWSDATHATRSAKGTLSAYYTATEHDVIAWAANSTDPLLGFYGATPVAKAGSTADLKDSLASVGLITNSGATPLDLDGGALTAGGATISATAATVNITGTAGNIRSIKMQSAGVDRFIFGLNAGTESGSNNGSDFILQRFNDAGASLGLVLTVTRSSGLSTFASAVTINGAVILASSLSVTSNVTLSGSSVNMSQTDSGTTTIPVHVVVGHNSSGTPAAGFGVATNYRGKSNTTNDQDMGRIRYEWVDATHASRASRGTLSAFYTTTERTVIQWEANATVSLLGLHGNTPVARPTYGAPTGGAADRSTFDTTTVTLPQLAQRVRALIDDLRSRGDFA